MSGKFHNGDYAFPLAEDDKNYRADGMSLRDYFAAKALNAILLQVDCGIQSFSPSGHVSANSDERAADVWARNAYDIADAMLTARGY